MSIYRIMCEYESTIAAQTELIERQHALITELSRELALYENIDRIEGLTERIEETDTMLEKLRDKRY